MSLPVLVASLKLPRLPTQASQINSFREKFPDWLQGNSLTPRFGYLWTTQPAMKGVKLQSLSESWYGIYNSESLELSQLRR